MKVLREMVQKKSDMQIAALIDVVFLLLIYFMVTATLIKKEADMSFLLPSSQTSIVDVPLEVLIEINEPGDILIEGMQFPDADKLVEQLASLKASADLSASELIVNILPADKTKHGQVVAVMDACAAAKVDNVAFCM